MWTQYYLTNELSCPYHVSDTVLISDCNPPSSPGPSMTGIDSAMKRRYIGMEFSIGDGAGPSSAMHIGD